MVPVQTLLQKSLKVCDFCNVGLCALLYKPCK